MADVSQIKLPNGSVYDLIDEKSGYITAEYIENKTDYEIPVSRVGEIVVGETAIGTDSTNFPTSKAVVDYVDERVVQEIDAIDVGVISVNGKTGSVTLSASDIGAATISQIPTSTSQLTNDSGFITSDSDEKLAVSRNLDNGGVYDVVLGSSTDPINTETKFQSKTFQYTLFNNTASLSIGNNSARGELRLYGPQSSYSTRIRSTAIASNYTIHLPNKEGTIALTSDIPSVPSWALQSTKPTYTANEVGALPSSTIIPSKTSDLTNDSGFLTSYTETDPTVPSWAKASTKPSYGLTEISGTDDLRVIEALTGTSGLLKKTAANTWTLDTNTYLTSYTETDPTVPSWAKASTKPTYTAAEVGALPDTTTIPSKTSDLTNDSGFITSYTDEKLGLSLASSPVYYYPILTQDTTTAGKKSYDNDGFQYYNYNGTTSDVGNAKLTLGNNKTATTAKNKQGTLELYGSTAYAIRITAGAPTVIRNIEFPNKDGTIALTSDIPTVPTKVSDLTNDSGFISSYTETDPVFTASAAAGITATDISNWNAKVSDDKTWNGVTLNNTTLSGSTIYIPARSSATNTNAYNITASTTPISSTIGVAMYNSSGYLNSKTPSANDNSTKVATTAYVDAAIPKVYSSTNTGGYLTMATLPIYDGTVV